MLRGTGGRKRRKCDANRLVQQMTRKTITSSEFQSQGLCILYYMCPINTVNAQIVARSLCTLFAERDPSLYLVQVYMRDSISFLISHDSQFLAS